jgi:hypothetical protein
MRQLGLPAVRVGGPGVVGPGPDPRRGELPPADVGPLLEADVERFAVRLVDVERDLTERIAELIARSDRLRQLSDGDRLLLPDRAMTTLDRLTGLGRSPDHVTGQREALVPAGAMAPRLFDLFLTHLEHRLADPGYVDLTERAWDARFWEPDDPGSTSRPPRRPSTCWATATCRRCRPATGASRTAPPGTG